VTRRIPTEVEDIDAGWFEEILGAHIRAIDVLEAHSGTTGRARVALNHDEPGLPHSVFVKLAPFDEARRVFVDQEGMGIAEARFYTEIASDVPVRVPRPWYAAHDEAGRYVMVLEDLSAAGANFPGQRDPGLPSFVESVIDAFAALHAAFWGSPRFASDGDLAWVEERSRGYGSRAELVGFAAQQLGTELPAASRRLAELYLPAAARVPGLLTRGTRTLIHGDAHLGNMFADGATPGFLDWALVSFAPGIRDVAYFLGNSVPTDFRRSHESRLVTRYCERLQAAGVTLTFDQAWDQYRANLLTAWIAAIVTAGMGSALQAIEVGMGGLLRADAAIDDHDVAGLFARTESAEMDGTAEKFE
jgi:aminoglycoside phosphotransferase (APT) family kinase protein